MSSLFYFFKESLTGFTRNLSTTLGSIITIFLSLLIIGIFLVGGLIVDNTVKSVEDKVSITAYVSDDAEQSDIDTVMKAIEKMDGVQSVGFTTKDEALQNFSNSMSSSEIVDQLDGMNPLPASIDVELADPQMVEGIASQIEGNSTFAKIADEENPADSIKYGQSSVKRLFELTNYIRYIGVALVVLLIFIALVFINNTIRLAILAIEMLRRFALPQVSNTLAWLPIDLSMTSYLVIYAALIVAGLVIAGIGSLFAMRRYLKV